MKPLRHGLPGEVNDSPKHSSHSGCSASAATNQRSQSENDPQIGQASPNSGPLCERSTAGRASLPHVRSLTRRLDNLASARSVTPLRLRNAIAEVVLAQMLPPEAVKGGTAVVLRVGVRGSRFTRDVDASRAADTSTEDYVMRPVAVKLAYRDASWLTTELEIGHDEIGSTASAVVRLPDDLFEAFAVVGLPAPRPVAVLAVEHQLAQKLHACAAHSDGSPSTRPHDLVDLQILAAADPPDLAKLAGIGRRLFASRHTKAWPPNVVPAANWPTLYAAAAEGLDVQPDLHAALRWTAALIDSLPDT